MYIAVYRSRRRPSDHLTFDWVTGTLAPSKSSLVTKLGWQLLVQFSVSSIHRHTVRKEATQHFYEWCTHKFVAYPNSVRVEQMNVYGCVQRMKPNIRYPYGNVEAIWRQST